MFKDKIVTIMDTLDLNPTSLALFCGFDRSNISRIKNGTRVPSPTGKTTEKLASGIIAYCAESNCTDKLTELIGYDSSEGKEDLEPFLIKWLFDNSDKSSNINDSDLRFSRQSQNLSIAMRLADISNVSLSKILHIDPSLISRYRRGLRTINSNNSVSLELCHVLWEHIEKNDKMTELANSMNVDQKKLDFNTFSKWILTSSGAANANTVFTEKFLSAFNNSPQLLQLPGTDISGLTESSLSDNITTCYLGYDGLRSAVLRFLSTAIKNHSKQLLLYSDQNMDWLTADTTFRAQWAALMAECVRSGVHIFIIHNIDRNLSEMGEAITSWVPLYMSGMIESFYCNKQRHMRFSHTLFLNPGTCCIDAYNAIGTETEGIYHYYTDTQVLDAALKKFAKLKENSHPLLKINPQIPKEDENDVIVLENIGNFPYTRIEVTKSLVRVEHSEIKNLSFGFTHPLMCRAFQNYGIERQDSDIK